MKKLITYLKTLTACLALIGILISSYILASDWGKIKTNRQSIKCYQNKDFCWTLDDINHRIEERKLMLEIINNTDYGDWNINNDKRDYAKWYLDSLYYIKVYMLTGIPMGDQVKNRDWKILNLDGNE